MSERRIYGNAFFAHTTFSSNVTQQQLAASMQKPVAVRMQRMHM